MSARPNRSREDSTATRLGLLVVLGALVVLFSLLEKLLGFSEPHSQEGVPEAERPDIDAA